MKKFTMGEMDNKKDNKMVIACSERIRSGIYTFLKAHLQAINGNLFSDLIVPGFGMKPVFIFLKKILLWLPPFMVSRFSVLKTILHLS